MKHATLFSGIGGPELAASWLGWENVFHCEINDFGRKILEYYWPYSDSYNDITKTNFKRYANKIDVLTGGFPCQPYSLAGKRKGKEDERHLWPEMLRAIREIRPRWIVGENVFGLVNWSGGLVFEEVQADLEAQGYKVQSFILPASGVNAPHKRERIFIVAYSDKQRRNERISYRQKRHFQRKQKRNNSQNKPKRHRRITRFGSYGCYGITTNAYSRRQPIQKHGQKEPGRIAKEGFSDYWQNFPTQSPICGGNDGIPAELDGITFPKWRNESIKAYGNAIVPQVIYQIYKSIAEYETI